MIDGSDLRRQSEIGEADKNVPKEAKGISMSMLARDLIKEGTFAKNLYGILETAGRELPVVYKICDDEVPVLGICSRSGCVP